MVVTKSHRELSDSLYGNQQTLGESHERLDEQFTVLTRLVITTLNAVIERVNDVIKHETPPDLREGLLLESVTYESINQLFHMFRTLRERPDFRDYLRSFYMGELKSMEDIKNLPEPKVPETEVPEEVRKAAEAAALESLMENGGKVDPEAMVEITSGPARGKKFKVADLLAEREKRGGPPVVQSLDEANMEFPEGAQIFGGEYADEPESEEPSEEGSSSEGQAHELHVVRRPDGDANESANATEG